ncbi:TetR/AcrR family transcriptional regulator [Nocardioides sp. YIM B13467]|uniref:TetR/AcrR family transcriptional regulator n=1 Tax=Nocardioides sp. YIM B13467 TaxID=3366294 RepID=UPI0036729637
MTARTVSYGGGREALLEATVRVVARAGLRKLTNRAVAEEAGVTHGLVGHHFGSRDALIEAAMRYVVERSVAESELESPTGSVDDFARGLVDLVAADPEIQAFQYELSLEARRRPELTRFIREQNDAYRSAVRKALDGMGIGHVSDLDLAVFATLDGLVFHQVTEDRPEDTEAGLTALRALLRAAGAQ